MSARRCGLSGGISIPVLLMSSKTVCMTLLEQEKPEGRLPEISPQSDGGMGD